MYQAKSTQNQLLELSSELNNGSLSLKDLYLDGLIINYLKSVEDSTDNLLLDGTVAKTASFTFVQNVMSKIKSGSVEISNEDIYVDNFDIELEQDGPFIGVSELIPSQGDISLDGIINNKPSEGSVKLFNEPLSSKSFNNVNNYSHIYSKKEDLEDSINDNRSFQTNEVVVNHANDVATTSKEIKDYLFYALALLAFVLPVLFALTKILNTNSSDSFSTIASVEQQTSYEVLNQVSSNIKNKPEPLTDGIQYVSLQVVHSPSVADLTLTSEQATNINIILYNFEIQKRLSE